MEKTRARQELGLHTVFSGAVGKGTETRSYSQNRKTAFIKLANSSKFIAWQKMETARKLGQWISIEEKVDKMMQEHNIKVEYGVS